MELKIKKENGDGGRQTKDVFFIFSLVRTFIDASVLLPLPTRWRDNDAGCLTISSHYHSPTPSIRLPLQLLKPTTNRLDSLLQSRDLKIASSHL